MARFKISKAKDVKEEKTSMSSPKKLQLLITVVNKQKTEYFVDMLYNFEINLQTVLSGHGTADDHIKSLLGLTDNEKSIIISAIRRDRANEALAFLDEKFRTVKGGKGIAFTLPVSSTIGVAIYQFLSNTFNGGQR
ncbi:MAG: hypothetical protein IJD79_02910 [Clostridia bacterium]|nr:hypothetical protein [Clostridia bacterium]